MMSEETRRFRYACRIMIVFGGICLTGALIPGFGIIGALGGFVMGWFGCAHAHARGWFDPSPAIDQEGEG